MHTLLHSRTVLLTECLGKVVVPHNAGDRNFNITSDRMAVKLIRSTAGLFAMVASYWPVVSQLCLDIFTGSNFAI